MIFAVKKQENKITEGLGTFQKCLLEKKDEQFLLLIQGHTVTLQILFLYVEFRGNRLEQELRDRCS